MSHDLQARYLTAFEGTQEKLPGILYTLLDDLEAIHEKVRFNPVNERQELEATVSSNFEFALLIHWNPEDVSPILITLDVTMFTPAEPYRLDQALAEPAANYFPELVLVYNSFGRERSVSIFPKLLDFENVVRELIVAMMLDYFGSDWWSEIMGTDRLNDKRQKAEYSRQLEADGKLHDSHLMHPLYYLNLKDLRAVMEQADALAEPEVTSTMPDPGEFGRRKRREWEAELAAKLPFARILENYDQVSIAAEISKIRELRNRVMHGRYLTESNEQTIKLICELYHRFLIEPDHVGSFESRVLREH